jgi:hypothetical protein
MSDPLTSSLAGLLAEAAADLDRASRGVPVCVASKAGRSTPGTKYHEGRWAALNEVARRSRRTHEDVALAASIVRRSWSDELARARQREAGRDWIAYREGGSDALDGLLGPDSGSSSEYTPGGMLLESSQDPV